MLALFGSEFLCGAGDDYRPCFSLVLQSFDQFREKFDLVFVEDLPMCSKLWESLIDPALAKTGYTAVMSSSIVQKIYQVWLPATFEEYLASLKAKATQPAAQLEVGCIASFPAGLSW